MNDDELWLSYYFLNYSISKIFEVSKKIHSLYNG